MNILFLIFVTLLTFASSNSFKRQSGFNQECPVNQEYSKCHSACPITCDNMDEELTTCAPVCVAGCACVAGYVLDKNDDCIKKSECPAKPEECPVHQEYSECHSTCPTTCENMDEETNCPQVCVAGCACVSGYVLDKNGDCIKESECPAKPEECPENSEYNVCGSACPSTCENQGNVQTCTPVCVKGCFCNWGYVLNKEGKCIPIEECCY